MNVLTSALQDCIQQKEQQAAALEKDPWRLKLHLMPPTGFLNDPNGLCYFRGLWHVFFQYAPFSPQGGLKCWGHYTSPDLLHWTYWGVPLLPDQPFDCHGEYSGSALVQDGVLHLFFSGNLFCEGDPPRAFSVIHVTSEDGFRFSSKKVVLSPCDYPEACSCQIRDPKVWREGSEYRMVIGAQTARQTGALLLYRSADLESWQFDRLLQPSVPFGYMWECPDIFALDGGVYLSVSPQGVDAEPDRYANIFQSVWTPLGGPADFRYTEWDKGFDFYAPQTFEAPDGRRILYGWMGMDALSGYTNPTTAFQWQHALTLPRVITQKDGVLRQLPVGEIEQLRRERRQIDLAATLPLPLELRLDNPENLPFTLDIGPGLHFKFDPGLQAMQLYFTDSSGYGRTERHARSARCRDLRAWIDTSSIEIFAEEGQEVFTSRFYPAGPSLPLVLHADSCCQLTAWTLEPMTFEKKQPPAETE